MAMAEEGLSDRELADHLDLLRDDLQTLALEQCQPTVAVSVLICAALAITRRSVPELTGPTNAALAACIVHMSARTAKDSLWRRCRAAWDVFWHHIQE